MALETAAPSAQISYCARRGAPCGRPATRPTEVAARNLRCLRSGFIDPYRATRHSAAITSLQVRFGRVAGHRWRLMWRQIAADFEGRDDRQHEIAPEGARIARANVRTRADWCVERQLAIRADGGGDFERPEWRPRSGATSTAIWD